MYYFIHILYTISTVSSFSLELDESVAIGFGLSTDINDTLNSNLAQNSDPDKAALISLRRDLTHHVTHRAKDYDPSLWYSVKSFGPAGKLSVGSKESFSSDSDDSSNSDANFEIAIKKPKKPIKRTSKRKHKALYKSSRVHSSWTKKYDKGRNRKNKTRDRNKRNHKQKKKYIDQDLNNTDKTIISNKKEGAVGLYIDNARQILYNTTHYSLYLKPLHGAYDIGDLWNKQQIVKPFDDSFKVPLPSNKLRNKISAPGNKRHKNKVNSKNISLLIGKNKPRNVNKVIVDHDGRDAKLHTSKKTVDGPKYDNVYDLIKFYLNELELPKLNVTHGSGRTDAVSISFPEDWFEKVKEVSESVVKGAENLWQKTIKPALDDAVTVKPIEFFVTMKPAEIVHDVEDKVVHVAHDVENLWDKEVKPNVIDKVKDVFAPGGDHGTTAHEAIAHLTTAHEAITHLTTINLPTVHLTTVPGIKNVSQTIADEAANLWQPWIHRVRDDVKINSFMNHILKCNLKIFDIVERKSKEKSWKMYVKYLAMNYEDKFNEFVRDTSQHKIKSRMGSERVILNSIDVSNRILTKLVAFAMDEIDKNGYFKQNVHKLKMIGEKFNVETNTILERACTKLNVCRRKNGFMDFVGDIFTKMSSLEGKKFEQATNAMTAAVKKTDLTESLGSDVTNGLHTKASNFERLPYSIKVGAFGIMKNIVVNRNTPLVVYGDGKVGATYKTIAMLDIFKTLDENVPVNNENVKEWSRIKANLKNFVQDRTKNVDNTMRDFVKHTKKVIDATHKSTKLKIRNSAQQIFMS